MVTNTIWYRPYYIFTNKLIDVTIYFYLIHFVATFYYFRNANWESTNEGYIDVGDKSILVTIFGCWRRHFNIVVIFWNLQVYVRPNFDETSAIQDLNDESPFWVVQKITSEKSFVFIFINSKISFQLWINFLVSLSAGHQSCQIYQWLTEGLQHVSRLQSVSKT